MSTAGRLPPTARRCTGTVSSRPRSCAMKFSEPAEHDMSENPYQSSGSPSNEITQPAQIKSRRWRAFAASGACLFCFLLPSWGVIASHAYPGPPFLELPEGDNIVSRISIYYGVPMEPLLLGSLIGSVVSV